MKKERMAATSRIRMIASSNFPRNFSQIDSVRMGLRRFLPKDDRLRFTSSGESPLVAQEGNKVWIS
jgi:hypothetical protein